MKRWGTPRDELEGIVKPNSVFFSHYARPEIVPVRFVAGKSGRAI